MQIFALEGSSREPSVAVPASHQGPHPADAGRNFLVPGLAGAKFLMSFLALLLPTMSPIALLIHPSASKAA